MNIKNCLKITLICFLLTPNSYSAQLEELVPVGQRPNRVPRLEDLALTYLAKKLKDNVLTSSFFTRTKNKEQTTAQQVSTLIRIIPAYLFEKKTIETTYLNNRTPNGTRMIIEQTLSEDPLGIVLMKHAINQKNNSAFLTFFIKIAEKTSIIAPALQNKNISDGFIN